MTIGRIVLAVLFLASGTLHFLSPGPFIRIVPPFLPWPAAIVAISGAAEIAGGLGLLMERTRRFAAFGLVALLIAVFPANIYMAVAGMPLPGAAGHPWVGWARLPLQFLMIYWAWIYTGRSRARP